MLATSPFDRKWEILLLYEYFGIYITRYTIKLLFSSRSQQYTTPKIRCVCRCVPLPSSLYAVSSCVVHILDFNSWPIIIPVTKLRNRRLWFECKCACPRFNTSSLKLELLCHFARERHKSFWWVTLVFLLQIGFCWGIV